MCDCLHLTNNQAHCQHSQMIGVNLTCIFFLLCLVYLAILFNHICHRASADRTILSSEGYSSILFRVTILAILLILLFLHSI